MRRVPAAARVAALAGVCTVGVLAIAPAASGARAATRSRTIQVWMAGHSWPPQRFVDAVSTPGSPSYHQFLSPGAYTRRFGPSAAHVNAVESYLTGVGLTRVRASVNDVYVSAPRRSRRSSNVLVQSPAPIPPRGSNDGRSPDREPPFPPRSPRHSRGHRPER